MTNFLISELQFFFIVPADCVGDGINQAVLGSTAVKEKGIIEGL